MSDISEAADASAPLPQGDAVTFGDKNVELSSYDRYKGTKGRKDRFAIISSTLLRMWTFYHPGSGGNNRGQRFVAPANKETLDFVKKTLGEPEQRFGMVLFHYTTDEKGELVDPSKLKGTFKPWLISENRFSELTEVHKQYAILDGGFGKPQSDLLFACTDDQYQKGTFLPTPTAHWKSKQAWYDIVKAKEPKVTESLKRYFGKKLTDLEIMALLGGGAGVSPGNTDNAGSIDLGDVLSE